MFHLPKINFFDKLCDLKHKIPKKYHVIKVIEYFLENYKIFQMFVGYNKKFQKYLEKIVLTIIFQLKSSNF